MGIFSYFFYDSFLGETPFSTHKKTTAPPRYSHDTVFHWNCLIQMSFKISFSNIFIFGCGSLNKSCRAVRYWFLPHFPLVPLKVKLLNWSFWYFGSYLKQFCPIFLFFKIVFLFWYFLKTTNLPTLNLVIPQCNISSKFWNLNIS